MRRRLKLHNINTLSVLVICFLTLLAGFGQAKTVTVETWDVEVEYGAYDRGDVFHDTLSFVESDGSSIISTEIDPTCECLTGDILGDGSVAFRLEVLQEEYNGPTEKLMYVFTRTSSLDLLRVRLKFTVNPRGNLDEDEADEDAILGHGVSERATAADDTIRGQVDLIFFHSPGCRTCNRIMEFTLPGLQQRWGDRLDVHEVDLDERHGYARLLAARDHYGVEKRAGSFLVAVGDTALQTTADLYNRLDRSIEKALRDNAQTYMALDIEPEEGVQKTRSVFRSMGFWTVTGAGLLDGLNPCAFATIVFFISLLSYAGSTKRQILIVGTGFSVSVFAVYLLLGLGAFRALQALSAYSLIGTIIWWLTIGLLAALILLSLRDTIQYFRTGQTRDAFLQLSRGTKRRIHESMRRGLKTSNLLLASIGIGATVTLFEAACTGQVYLPAIVLMLNDPLMSDQAWLYLVLYNLLFIVPLLVVFALTYIGIGSSSFADWSKRHYGLTRIALTLLFAAFLAVLLIQGV
ncbi:hypothetical protein KQI52_15875 [bacterium]|nr:hypothetical protein [bacterium]